MNADQMKEMIDAGQLEAVEAAWMQAIEEKQPLDAMANVLEALVKAEHLDTAETLGWALLAERTEQLSAEQALEVARAVVSAVAVSDELRGQAADLYRQVYGKDKHFETLLKASGLLSGQSPRRAFRTLDVRLGVQPGTYLANRFDNQVIQFSRYDDGLGEFVLIDSSGKSLRLEPKKLADEFDPADAKDFRVLVRHRPEDLRQLLDADPAAVLIGICLAYGGQIDSTRLKDLLVPAHLEAQKWSGWWNRARTAAKRSPSSRWRAAAPSW